MNSTSSRFCQWSRLKASYLWLTRASTSSPTIIFTTSRWLITRYQTLQSSSIEDSSYLKSAFSWNLLRWIGCRGSLKRRLFCYALRIRVNETKCSRVSRNTCRGLARLNRQTSQYTPISGVKVQSQTLNTCSWSIRTLSAAHLILHNILSSRGSSKITILKY